MAKKIGKPRPIDAILANCEPQVVAECTITIRGKLLTMNEVLGKNGKAVGKIKKQESDRILLAWRDAGCPRINGCYKVHLHIVSSTRRDPSNISGWAFKSVLDALQVKHTGHGVIEDDDYKHHVSDSCSYEYVRGKNAYDMIKATFTAVDAEF